MYLSGFKLEMQNDQTKTSTSNVECPQTVEVEKYFFKKQTHSQNIIAKLNATSLRNN